MEFSDEAIVLTLLPHGEHGAIVRFLCLSGGQSDGQSGGLRAGFVHGAHGKARRAIFSPGNRVALKLKARAENSLPVASAELVESRALLAFDPAAAALLHWLTALTAAALAECVAHPRLARALDALLSGLGAGLQGEDARAALARYELLLLEEEGFGLDLASCALDGPADDLGHVSPRSGRAVSRAMAHGQPWEKALLPLPPFLLRGGKPGPGEADQALALSGHFLARHWLADPRLDRLRARALARTAQA
ncbi:DNA repair protein RecO [Sandaracinobacteroides sp. A072]|uniref:DNA repair protein RecO n=1 Tax=Sandaracinobacteroides sp. A072 TaxID=3461146 RepID=UPI0040416BA0